ncbi:hypothetical protein ACFPN7_20460 [Amycolatopsis halotolerans]|uniref:hypothetical protein n=1 Tax=Amycolatopsis halotolerans TaxID=330083 RepID=UPI0036245EB9
MSPGYCLGGRQVRGDAVWAGAAESAYPGPVCWPPLGAFTLHPSVTRSSRFRSIAWHRHQRGLVRGGEDSGVNPLAPAGPRDGRGDAVVDVLWAGAARCEPGQAFVEDDPAWDPGTMAPRRAGDRLARKQRGELVPRGFGDEGGQDGQVT